MGRLGRLLVVLTVVLAGAVALPPEAAAHALLTSSDPPAGAIVASPPSAVTLTFSEAPDTGLSTVRVLNASGQDVGSGPAQIVPGQPLELRVPLGQLPDGVYTVSWRTVSAVDGHLAAGSFAFGVGVAPAAAGPGANASPPLAPNPSPLGLVGRWLLYLGLALLIGAAFVRLAIIEKLPRSVLRTVVGAWVAVAVGTAAVVAGQMADSGADLGTILGSSLARAAFARAVGVIGAGLAVSAVWTGGHPRSRRRWGALGVIAGVVLLIDVVLGHASAGALPPYDIEVQWIHGFASGAWIGGLAILLLVVRGEPDEERSAQARAFSRWAALWIGFVAVTGVLRAIGEVRTIDALLASDYGRLVIIKSALLVVLALFGAANRWISVPRSGRSLRPLRRVGSLEVTTGAVLLAVTALLVNATPPASGGSAAPTPAPSAAPSNVVVTGSDFGTSVRVKLVIAPGTAGPNRFSASVVDYDSGQPVPATGISLRFALATQTGVGGSTLALPSAGSGTFAAAGTNLSIDGLWNVTATIAGPSGTVEVPLVVATAVPPQVVDKVATSGAPTIDTVHLSAGLTVQLYLDPGMPGHNDLHATFFDAKGTELAVPAATFLVAPAQGPAAILNPRTLEPGHFVATTTLQAGDVVVDVVGTSPSGGVLHAHLTMEVAP